MRGCAVLIVRPDRWKRRTSSMWSEPAAASAAYESHRYARALLAAPTRARQQSAVNCRRSPNAAVIVVAFETRALFRG